MNGVTSKHGRTSMVEAQVRLHMGIYDVYCIYDRGKKRVLSAALYEGGEDVYKALPPDVREAVDVALSGVKKPEAAVVQSEQPTAQIIMFPGGTDD